MTKLRAIGFDLDNTLYDQAQHMRSFFRAAAEHVASITRGDARAIEVAFLDVWTRKTSYYPKLFDEVLEQAGLFDASVVRTLVSLYHCHRAELTLFAGVREMLDRLRTRFSLFMITDGNEQMQRGKIDCLQLAACFDELVVTGSHGKEWSKPAHAPYRHVLQRFGGDPGEYLYVGDNPACDFLGARQLGMRTARVMTEPFAHHVAATDAHDAEIRLTKITDLEQVLDDLQTLL